MNELDERMRQFTVVVKYAMQTDQIIPRRFVPSSDKPSLRAIATKHFALNKRQYDACYHRARNFLRSIRNSATSDDMLATMKEAA
jgi:3-isopropylmalate dehydratase small subunit